MNKLKQFFVGDKKISQIRQEAQKIEHQIKVLQDQDKAFFLKQYLKPLKHKLHLHMFKVVTATSVAIGALLYGIVLIQPKIATKEPKGGGIRQHATWKEKEASPETRQNPEEKMKKLSTDEYMRRLHAIVDEIETKIAEFSKIIETAAQKYIQDDQLRNQIIAPFKLIEANKSNPKKIELANLRDPILFSSQYPFEYAFPSQQTFKYNGHTKKMLIKDRTEEEHKAGFDYVDLLSLYHQLVHAQEDWTQSKKVFNHQGEKGKEEIETYLNRFDEKGDLTIGRQQLEIEALSMEIEIFNLLFDNLLYELAQKEHRGSNRPSDEFNRKTFQMLQQKKIVVSSSENLDKLKHLMFLSIYYFPERLSTSELQKKFWSFAQSPHR